MEGTTYQVGAGEVEKSSTLTAEAEVVALAAGFGIQFMIFNKIAYCCPG